MIYTIFLFPVKSDITTKAKNIKNNTLAILAAPAAIPPNPNTAAIIAKMTKVTVQRNILFVFN